MLTGLYEGGEPVKISVIVPMFDAADVIATQLGALSDQVTDVTFEVIVVDDLSTDGGAAVVASFAALHPGIRLVSGDGYGSYAARNTGVKASGSELLLFCDADDRADPTWVNAMAGALELHCIVAGSTPLDALNDPVVRQWRSDDHLAEPRRFGHIIVGTTANLGIRRSVFERVGGFREDVRNGDDVGICCRAHRLGIPVVHEIRAVVQYRTRSTLHGHLRQGVQYGRSWHRLCVEYGEGDGPGPTPVRLVGSLVLNIAQSAAARIRADRAMLGVHTGNTGFAWGALTAWLGGNPAPRRARWKTVLHAPVQAVIELRHWRRRSQQQGGGDT